MSLLCFLDTLQLVLKASRLLYTDRCHFVKFQFILYRFLVKHQIKPMAKGYYRVFSQMRCV